jgi:RNA polymerase sigma factor (sigma-70 family)
MYSAEQIKESLLKNDPEVFRYLYRQFGGMIIGYVKKNKGTDVDAQEMVQTVMLELWQAVQNNRYTETGKMDRFIYMLTANTWRDELRRRKIRRTESLDTAVASISDDGESVALAIIKDKRIEAIHHCLDRMEKPCDDIIRLFHLKEIPLQEVAERMQYDYNNLRKRIFDCRKKLKKMVDDFISDK